MPNYPQRRGSILGLDVPAYKSEEDKKNKKIKN
jgi:hypothetical protein